MLAELRMRRRDEPARFGIVLYDGVEPIDVGGTIRVVSMAASGRPTAQPLVSWWSDAPGAPGVSSGLFAAPR